MCLLVTRSILAGEEPGVKMYGPLPSSVREMTAVEAAWVGALIEGEGSMIAHPRGRTTWAVTVQSTDVETIATLLRLTGAGLVYSKRVPDGRKPQWSWEVRRKFDVRDLLYQVCPYLTGKRERAAWIYEAAGGRRVEGS